jgi:hypothetical protein
MTQEKLVCAWLSSKARNNFTLAPLQIVVNPSPFAHAASRARPVTTSTESRALERASPILCLASRPIAASANRPIGDRVVRIGDSSV